MTLNAGAKLGRYEIRSKIGAGGMGEVYRANDPQIGRDVAIKVLSTDFAVNKERVARFEQEAQAAGALNHPTILAIYDVNKRDHTLYVVSELLSGEELRDRLDHGQIPLRRAIDYAQGRPPNSTRREMIKQIFGVCLVSIMREHQRDYRELRV
jgi:eukaryotic-like serine/threonine-protein kinase